ncbi:MAG TPA: glucose 1-dehydrogenase [Candidatus Limnocylindria bacterium]|nr:glucose 1-dehydrogenase [Candidatus Limnocylindria bacterium]
MDPARALLTGRTAIVTGGGAGIGRGIAGAVVAFGGRVAVLEIDPERAARARSELPADRAVVVTGDARTPQALTQVLAAARDAFGDVQILVNNVGGVFHRWFLDSPEKAWDAMLRVNLRSVLHGTQIVGRHMQEHGRGGSIVNVVTIEASRAAPGYAVYAAAKAAVVSFTRTMALELAPHRIRVNAIAPDICMTEGLAAVVPPGDEARFADIVPLGRAGEVDDVAGAAVFLASEMASYVTGVLLPVDGGTAAAGGWYHDNGGWVLGPPRRRP